MLDDEFEVVLFEGRRATALCEVSDGSGGEPAGRNERRDDAAGDGRFDLARRRRRACLHADRRGVCGASAAKMEIVPDALTLLAPAAYRGRVAGG